MPVKLSDVLKPRITPTLSKILHHLESMKDDELVSRKELGSLLGVSTCSIQNFDTRFEDYKQNFRKTIYYGKPVAIRSFRKQIGGR